MPCSKRHFDGNFPNIYHNLNIFIYVYYYLGKTNNFFTPNKHLKSMQRIEASLNLNWEISSLHTYSYILLRLHHVFQSAF